MFELPGVFVGGCMKRECGNCGNRDSRECSNCMVTCFNGEDITPPSKWKPEVKPKTNGDKIRAMDDETLARQLLSVINEAVAAIAGKRLPEEISDVFEGQLLAKLKLPVEDK